MAERCKCRLYIILHDLLKFDAIVDATNVKMGLAV